MKGGRNGRTETQLPGQPLTVRSLFPTKLAKNISVSAYLHELTVIGAEKQKIQYPPLHATGLLHHGLCRKSLPPAGNLQPAGAAKTKVRTEISKVRIVFPKVLSVFSKVLTVFRTRKPVAHNPAGTKRDRPKKGCADALRTAQPSFSSSAGPPRPTAGRNTGGIGGVDYLTMTFLPPTT